MIAAQPLPPVLARDLPPLEPALQLKSFLDEVESLARELRAVQARSFASASLAAGWKVLQLLDRAGPQTVPQIARANSTTRQNSQILVNRLLREGAVEFTTNPCHKRSDLVRLTRAGAALLSASTAGENNFLHEMLGGISEGELIPASTVVRHVRQQLRTSGGRQFETRPARSKPSRESGPGPTSRGTFKSASLPVQAPLESETSGDAEAHPTDMPFNLL